MRERISYRMPWRIAAGCGLFAMLVLALAACGSAQPAGAPHQPLVYVTDSDIVSGTTARGYVTALDAQTGHVVWRTETGQLFGQPLIASGKVYVAGVILPPCCNGGAQSGELSALDARSGHVLWQEKMPQVPSAAILADGTLYLTETDSAGQRSLVAINASDGKTRWTNANQDGVRAVVGDVIYAERHSEGGTELPHGSIAALRVSDGTPLWTASVPFSFNTIEVAGGRIVVFIQDVAASIPHTITQRLRIYDAATGKQLWDIADSGQTQLFQSIAASDTTGDTLYATESTGVAALRLADGTPLWRAPTASRAFLLLLDSTTLYAVSESGVVALNRGDGRQVWSAPGRAFDRGDGAVYLMRESAASSTGQETVAALEGRTGTVRWSVSVPDLLPTEYPPLPIGENFQTISAIGGDALYLVVRARGQSPSLLALRERDGATLWRYQTSGGVGAPALAP